MITEPDAQAADDPVADDHNQKIRPAEREKSGNQKNVKRRDYTQIAPVYTLTAGACQLVYFLHLYFL